MVAAVRGARALLAGCLPSVSFAAAALAVQRIAGPALVLGVGRGERLGPAVIVVVTAALGLLRASFAERVVRTVRRNVLRLHLRGFEGGDPLSVPSGDTVTPAIAVSTPVAIGLAIEGIAPLLAAVVAIPVVLGLLATAVPPRALGWILAAAFAGALVTLALARVIQRAWARTWSIARRSLGAVASSFDGVVDLRVHARTADASAKMLASFEEWSRAEGRARRLQVTSTWGTLLAMVAAGGALALLTDGAIDGVTEIHRVGLLFVAAVPAFQLVLSGGAHLLRARSVISEAAAMATIPESALSTSQAAAGPAWSPRSTIELRGVAYAYPSEGRPSLGLSPTSLRLDPGARVAVLGGNGAGKTTLLHILAGVMSPTTGEILIDGEPAPRSVAISAPRLAYLSQRPFEHSDGSIADNLRAFDPSLDDAALLGELRRLGLWDSLRARASSDDAVLGLPMASLSQGQRRRIFLARTLLSRAHLILLDEPEANLDSAAIAALVARLRELGPERRVVAAIHDPSALGWETVTLRLGDV